MFIFYKMESAKTNGSPRSRREPGFIIHALTSLFINQWPPLKVSCLGQRPPWSSWDVVPSERQFPDHFPGGPCWF